MESQANINKLMAPHLPQAYPRTRLFEWLDAARAQSLIWLSAAAGSGKTTLVASWLRARETRVHWYRVDEGDADLSSFFYHLSLLGKRAAPHCKPALPRLTAEYSAGLPAFSHNFFRELFRRIKAPDVLVLENFQDAGAALQTVLQAGCAEIPAGVNVLVISRDEPPPMFARWQANGALAVLDWAQLRLTADETRAIVSHAADAPVSEDAVQALHTQTDGWAAGLMLLGPITSPSATDTPVATASLSAENSPSASTTDAAGSQALFDYFASELYDRLAPDVRRVLTRSAILASVSPAAARRLSGCAQAESLLEKLCRSNTFTRRVLGPSYEFHPLFRAFLLRCLRDELSASALAQLQRQAAEWSANNGHIGAAIGHYVAAGEHAVAAELIITHAPRYLAQGRSKTVVNWVTTLPAASVAQNPWLAYWQGRGELASDPRAARLPLEQAYAHFKASGDPAGQVRAWCAVVDSYVFEWRCLADLDHWIAEAEPMNDALLAAVPACVADAFACGLFTALMLRQPEHAMIRHWAQQVQDIVLFGDDLQLRFRIGPIYLQYATGTDLKGAKIALDALRSVGQQVDWCNVVSVSLQAMAAGIGQTVGQHRTAIRHVSDGLAQAEQSGVHIWDQALLGHATMSALLHGERTQAEDYLAQMASSLVADRYMDLATYYFAAAWHALHYSVEKSAVEKSAVEKSTDAKSTDAKSTDAQNAGTKNNETSREIKNTDVQTALRYAQLNARFLHKSGIRLYAPYAKLILAQATFASGAVDEARACVAQALALAEAAHNWLALYIAWLLTAHIAHQQGEHAECLAALRQGLAIAAEEGMVVHALAAAEIRALYGVALANGIEVDYVQMAIRRQQLAPPAPQHTPDNWPYPVRIYTLGRFSVRVDGVALDDAQKKKQAKPLTLLKALIALGARDVHDEKLQAVLWPDAEGDAAHRALITNLQRLRKLLGSAAVSYSDGHLSLSAQHCWVDMWAFERGISALPQSNDETSPNISQNISQSTSHYQGGFLPNEEAPWALPLRERLRRKFKRAVLAHAERLEASGAWADVINHYQQALDADPACELCYQGLMRAYAKLGRPQDALKAFDDCRELLQALYAISPSPRTESLHQEIRKNAAAFAVQCQSATHS